MLKPITLLLALLVCSLANGQERKLTKIHIYTRINHAYDFYTAQDDKTPISISDRAYTLIETDMDTLKVIFNNRSKLIVNIPFTLGQTYYYVLTGDEHYSSVTIPPIVKETTEREFLLNVALMGVSYRRYSLTRASGLKLLDKYH